METPDQHDTSEELRGYAYLTIESGPRIGTNYLLEPDAINRLGRGIDCDVVLADPLCSRVHAEISVVDGHWRLRDTGSRNGTYVNDKRVGVVRLKPGASIKLGSSEFTFHYTDAPPTLAVTRDNRLTESIVREASVDAEDSGRMALAALRRSENAHELADLYDLSVELLGADNPRRVLEVTLQLVHERTNAELTGYLWVSEEGKLKTQMCVPETSEPMRLSRTLNEVVVGQKRAIWVANQAAAASSESMKAYADALCVPTIHEGHVLGALHLYLGDGRFRDIDFDFAISVSQLLGVALARARREAQLTVDRDRLADSAAAGDEILGQSQAITDLKSIIQKVGAAQGAILILGESGSGKELVARAVHQASSRADRPLLAVNCAAIPPNLVESQLFGHVKGAFTGATEDHRGWFEQSHTGTLFLDEIGELPLEAQAKLLRILEGHPFQPVGSAHDVHVDVRVLAATNRNLKQHVDAKNFREDLYYRLGVFEIRVPPLRDRNGDIELLLDHFLNHFRKRHGRPDLTLSADARSRLLDYAWPGNVRQMRNVIDSAVVLADGDTIQSEDIGLHDAGTDHLDTLRIDDWERRLIRQALQRSGGNVPDAAKLLGIGRATLYRKIDEYKIQRRG
jgi:two-component system response regulator HydG